MSPARARTSDPAIIAAARDLLEDGGLEAVSMAGIAERVGVRAPSLYKHFGDRRGLLAAVATEVALDLGRELTAAVDAAGPDPSAKLDALAMAYRSFALAKPRAAALLFAGLAPGVEPAPEANATASRPVLHVAEALVGPASALAAARVLTAFAYGFTSMESAGAFRLGGNVEEAYRLGISVLLAGLERSAAGPAQVADSPQAAATVDPGS
jgi:AcrR family transcriptional regulator